MLGERTDASKVTFCLDERSPAVSAWSAQRYLSRAVLTLLRRAAIRKGFCGDVSGDDKATRDRLLIDLLGVMDLVVVLILLRWRLPSMPVMVGIRTNDRASMVILCLFC